VEVGSDGQRETDHDQALNHDAEHRLGDAAEVERATPDRGDEQAVHGAAVDVFDEAHPGPPRARDREHDDHPRGKELDVGAAREAGDVDGALEQRPEEEQPDDGLDERDADPGRLAQKRPDVT
jgi:hypothetical protein